jgi:hypothetical protein
MADFRNDGNIEGHTHYYITVRPDLYWLYTGVVWECRKHCSSNQRKNIAVEAYHSVSPQPVFWFVD